MSCTIESSKPFRLFNCSKVLVATESILGGWDSFTEKVVKVNKSCKYKIREDISFRKYAEKVSSRQGLSINLNEVFDNSELIPNFPNYYSRDKSSSDSSGLRSFWGLTGVWGLML